MEGTILEIQRMSTEDGPGIRTTVFFKGCSLRCTWCHNPESISGRPQIQWIGSKCIGCRTCLETCSNQVLSLNESGMLIDRKRCQACGECEDACPSTAMELLGKKWSLDQLAAELAKDKVYYDKSDGGVTLSGGEPCLQPHFATALAKSLREKGIQTALDTCGLCSKSALEMLLPYSTLVLFDIKEIDPARHLSLTGFDNETILSNLQFVADFMRSNLNPKALWVRTPIIPGATDTAENIRGIGRFISTHLGKAVDRWELCTFNNLCRDKYLRLGLDWEFSQSQLVEKEAIEYLTSIARESGVDPEKVHWSGSTRLEENPLEAPRTDRQPVCTDSPVSIKNSYMKNITQ